MKRALLSVTDKEGIVEFARGLVEQGFALLSTGGTHRKIQEAGIEVQEVADYTGFPEMMDGRVKTLHPKVHGGLLARRDLETHTAAMQQHGIDAIDLLCVNLYRFREAAQRDGVSRDEVVEQHDTDHVNLVFNNAGISGGGSLFDGTRESWDRTFAICWGGVYWGTRAFLPLLAASEEGHLGDVGSSGQQRLDRGRPDLLPARDDHVTSTTEHPEGSVGVEGTVIAGVEPAVGVERVRVVAVGPEQHRPPQADAARRGDVDLDTVDESPVVDDTRPGLGHAVGGDHVGGPVRRGGGTTDEHGPEGFDRNLGESPGHQ